MKLRKGICYLLVGGSVFVQVGGCLPFLPGTFAMMCLENEKKGWLLLTAVVGLVAGVAWIDAIRYMLTILIILIGSVVMEKMHGRKESLPIAIWTFLAVFFVGISGVLMEGSSKGILSAAIEGLFGFGLVLAGNRFVHWFLTPKEKIFVTRPIAEGERSKRVKQYVLACEKLASVFAPPQYECVSVSGMHIRGNETPTDGIWGQSRAAISRQLLAIAGNIEKCTQETVYLCNEDQQLLRRLEYELKENGIQGREFSFFEDAQGCHQLEFYASTILGQNLSLRSLGELVSQITGYKMLPREDMKVFLNYEERKVVFIQAGKYQVLSACKKQSGQGERICGDNEFFLSIEEGKKKVLGISDGMGRGLNAAKESELVLEVVEELLEAGFSPEETLAMLNSACALRNEEQGCPTLDICQIDTFTGVADWYKMGAAASFLRRGNTVEVLYGNTLPVGATLHARVCKQVRQLQDADTLVFMTDGALELLPTEHPEEMMKELILHIEDDNPANITEQLMTMLTELSGDRMRDDMLVCALKIWER